ncbi:Ribosomal RNA processing Brix domain protein, partial [Prunus dulcis]
KPSGTTVNISKWDFFIKNLVFSLSLSLSPAISLSPVGPLSLSPRISGHRPRLRSDRCQKNRLGLASRPSPPPTSAAAPAAGKWRFSPGTSPAPISLLRPPFLAIKVEILGNVQFIGETLPKFRQKVSVFSKWARHRGDVRNFKGFRPGFWKNSGGSFQF